MKPNLNLLTDKEILILDGLVKGLNAKEIAASINYEPNSIYTVINRIYFKLGVKKVIGHRYLKRLFR